MDFILSILPNKEIFFAGLFDAEGNINLEDKCIKWACQDKKKVEVYKKHLSKENLFDRYDGSCLISINIKKFDKLIFPYIKHNQKKDDFNLLMKRKAKLNKRFKKMLRKISDMEGARTTEIAKALKRVKIYAQVRVLEELGYISKRDHPTRLYLTKKGQEELNIGGKDKNDNKHPMFLAVGNHSHITGKNLKQEEQKVKNQKKLWTT